MCFWLWVVPLVLLISRPSKQKPIISGENAQLGQFPNAVSIQRNGQHVCGGAILNPKWIVSVAHCFNTYNNPNDYTVVAGAHPASRAFRQEMGVAQIVMHPDFASKNFMNDISLVMLSDDLRLNEGVSVLNPPCDKYDLSSKLRLAGWGRTNFSEKVYPDTLKYIDLQYTSNGECVELFKRDNAVLEIDDSKFCAVAKEVNQSGCVGDSGSPVMRNQVVVGLLNAGFNRCGGEPFRVPNLFTKLDAHFDFIERNVQHQVCNGLDSTVAVVDSFWIIVALCIALNLLILI